MWQKENQLFKYGLRRCVRGLSEKSILPYFRFCRSFVKFSVTNYFTFCPLCHSWGKRATLQEVWPRLYIVQPPLLISFIKFTNLRDMDVCHMDVCHTFGLGPAVVYHQSNQREGKWIRGCWENISCHPNGFIVFWPVQFWPPPPSPHPHPHTMVIGEFVLILITRYITNSLCVSQRPLL